MENAPAERRGDAVGREAELEALLGWLRHRRAARAAVLTGGPGIGKTTLWEAGIEAAQAGGLRVLVARPSEAEARLSYAALIDLLAGVDGEKLAALPPPQRRALDCGHRDHWSRPGSRRVPRGETRLCGHRG